MAPDGRFAGDVPLVPGENRIGVTALTSDGTRAVATIVVHYQPEELRRSNPELDLELRRLRERTRELERQVEQAEQAEEAERQRRLELQIRRGAPAPE
ncbi:MAG: hypothetical protein ACE147_07535 [Candidatus Methylomirabilales bacterium]